MPTAYMQNAELLCNFVLMLRLVLTLFQDNAAGIHRYLNKFKFVSPQETINIFYRSYSVLTVSQLDRVPDVS